MYTRSIILIPTLNERKNLETLLPAIFDLMPDISVLIVDDSSKDGTAKYIKSLQVKYPRLYILLRGGNFGYGRACLEGFRWVFNHDYDYVVTMDADFSHDFKIIPNLIEKLNENEAVIGSRYFRGGQVENWKIHRRVLSIVANYYVRTILGMKIRDITTGFNAYRTEILKNINLSAIKSDGYAFLVELKYRLSKRGYRIIEYPITFYERREGQSKMSTKVIWESIKLPWNLRFRRK
jgi:dolichol-phosphate mannosyltransferase